MFYALNLHNVICQIYLIENRTIVYFCFCDEISFVESMLLECVLFVEILLALVSQIPTMWLYIYIFWYTHSHTHSHTLTLTRIHFHTYTHTVSLTHTHYTYTYTYTYAYTYTYTTHTHSIRTRRIPNTSRRCSYFFF